MIPKTNKPKMGRPPLPKGETKDAQIGVRFKSDEYAKLDSKASSSGFTAPQLVREAAIQELKRPPIWIKSKWKWQELNEQSIQFELGTPTGKLTGLGRLMARPDNYDRITVDIFCVGPTYANSAPMIRIWLSEDAVNKIQDHPDPNLARFVLVG
jgi:hypothetical protein